MICPYCQSNCSDEVKYCPNCGNELLSSNLCTQNTEPKIIPSVKLGKAKCPNCGAGISVDTSLEASICPYCNNAFVVNKAINNFTGNVNEKDNKAQDLNRVSTAEKMENIGNQLQKTGNALSGCGCLMTIFITIPILIILFFLFK